MKKNLAAIFTVFVLVTVALFGGKFWEKKESTQWNEKEVIRLVTDSPWAHRVSFRVQNFMASGGDSGNSNREELGPDLDREYGEAGLVCDSSQGARGNLHNNGMCFCHPSRGDFGGDSLLLPLTVRWYALPIRHAIDRRAALRPEAKQVWNSVQAGELYLIGVSGLPAHMFPRDPDRLKLVSEHLKSESFLKIKGREPIPADAVIFPGKRSEVVDIRAGGWRAAVEIYVVFSRGQKGSQVITLADKKVDFVTRIGPAEGEAEVQTEGHGVQRETGTLT
jgi:hypothetical protein